MADTIDVDPGGSSTPYSWNGAVLSGEFHTGPLTFGLNYTPVNDASTGAPPLLDASLLELSAAYTLFSGEGMTLSPLVAYTTNTLDIGGTEQTVAGFGLGGRAAFDLGQGLSASALLVYGPSLSSDTSSPVFQANNDITYTHFAVGVSFTAVQNVSIDAGYRSKSFFQANGSGSSDDASARADGLFVGASLTF